MICLMEELAAQVTRQREALHSGLTTKTIRIYKNFVESHSVDRKQGDLAIAKNKIGVLLLAGGMGSRLSFHKPKGCFPILHGKSLYQCILEKMGPSAPLAIMTSDHTDQETKDFFEKHAFFGLAASRVDFFCQKSWPLLDENEEIFLQAPGKIALGPNGNGEALTLLVGSPIFSKWWALGIEYISLISVDNPLAEPLYPPLIAHHILTKAEVSLLVTKKRVPSEKMGVVGAIEGQMRVIEYSEIPLQLEHLFEYGNTGMMLFSMEFAKRIESFFLPLHVAKKKSKRYVAEKDLIEEINAYKFEQFIFDLLEYSEKSEALICERALLFAPLKEAEGPDGVESVRNALEKR